MATYTGTGGNDTFTGSTGTDTVSGMQGDDSLSGGDGADLIDGSGGTLATAALDLNWSLIPKGNKTAASITSGFTQDTGGINVTVGYSNLGHGTLFEASKAATGYVAAGETFSSSSAAHLEGTGQGQTMQVSLDFAATTGSAWQDEVTNVAFRLWDVDTSGSVWTDQVTILAYDADGNAVPVTITAPSDHVSGNYVEGTGSNDTSAQAAGSALVQIPGPVAKLQIIYANAGTGGQILEISDVQFTAVQSDEDTLHGGAGDDTLSGGAGRDLLYGEAGNDSLLGGAGNDRIDGGSENDVLRGGAGHDTLLGGTGNDTIAGEAGSDVIDGGAGDDLLDGGTEADTLAGGEGNDRLLGGAGADSLDGGAGSDTLAGGAGADTIAGGTGLDWVDYSGSAAPVDVDLTRGTGIGGDAQGDSYTGVDAILGSGGNDTLTGFDGEAWSGTDVYYNVIDGGAGNDLIDGRGGTDMLHGGSGNDTILGGAGNDSIWTGAGVDSATGGEGADSFFLNEGESAGDIIAGSEAGGVAQDDDTDIDRITVYGRAKVFESAPGSEAGYIRWANGETTSFSGIESITVVPCFTPGARVATPGGARPVESLRPGDLVLTRDSGPQPLEWAGRRDLGAAELAGAPQLAPVRIAAGALGPGLPARDLLVSPQHRMLIASALADLLFGEPEVLAAATHLVGRAGVERVAVPQVSYLHVMCARHEILNVEGAWTESFQPGALSVGGLDAPARDELLALFPDLGAGRGMAAARRTLRAHEAGLLRAA